MASITEDISRLTLSVGQYGELEWEGLAQEIQINTTITELNIEQLGNERCTMLADALKVNSSIHVLDLRGDNFDYECCKVIADILKYNPRIKRLGIHSNTGYQEGCKVIADALSTNSTLEHLNLSHSNISDEGSEALAHALQMNTTLYSLDLSDNKISTVGMKALSVSSFTNNCITIINLKNNNISNNQRKEYKEIKKNVTINKICKDLKIGANFMKEKAPESVTKESSIRAFIREQMKIAEGWKAIKFVIMGDDGIGKTSLLRTLVHENSSFHLLHVLPTHSPNVERTNGIDHTTTKLANGEVNVLDISGNSETRVVHHFFLSSELAIYIIAFDFGAPLEEQQKQISHWLDFLQSAVPPPSSFKANQTWRVMIVGLRADLKSTNPSLSNNDIPTWQRKWNKLPIFDSLFPVSTHKDHPSVNKLYKAIERQCSIILTSTHIPASYKYLLHAVRTHFNDPARCVIHRGELQKKCQGWMDDEGTFAAALGHLHAIGEVVLLPHLYLCTIPLWISNSAKKFLCSGSVVLASTHEGIPIKVGYVTTIESSDERANEVKSLCRFGICFEFPTVSSVQTSKDYLFPSLGTHSDHFHFFDKPTQPQYSGVQYVAPDGTIFIPGFFCKFIVDIFKKLRIHKGDLVELFCNGCVVKCPSLINGEIIVMISNDTKSISAVMMAANPDIEYITTVFDNLTRTTFRQYIGSDKNQVCPVCIEECDTNGGNLLQPLGTFRGGIGNQMCTRKHEINGREKEGEQPPHHTGGQDVTKCWTHKIDQHHFFINYRVALEGKAFLNSTEPVNGIAQLVFENLCIQKRKNGLPVYTYWDKKCLNYGQDWEKGFLHGLTTASVIVLLISSRSIEKIVLNAKEQKQDNVLLEYECALLQNKVNKTPVVPIFLSELGGLDGTGKVVFEEFGFRCLASLPDLPHVRSADAQKTILDLSKSLSPSETGFLASVSKTCAQLQKLQGYQLVKRGEDQQGIDEMINTLMTTLENVQA